MILDKETWHYQIYNFTFLNKTKEKTSLCRYVWRIILLPIPTACVLCMAVVFYTICLVVGNIMSIATGQGLSSPQNDPAINAMFKIHPFPDMRMGGRAIRTQVLARTIWAVVIALLVNRYFYVLPPNMQASLLHNGSIAAMACGGVLVAYFTYMLISSMGSNVRRKDSWALLKAYVEAKQERFCPIVTFK